MVKVPSAWRYPASDPVGYWELLPPLTAVPVQVLAAQRPCRVTRSKAAVASVGSPLWVPPEICWFTCCVYCGEVTNSPACTVVASPGRLTVPILVHRVPSAES